MELKPHQLKALSELRNGSILCGGVGVGKTCVALAYYEQHEAPTDLYVITTAKKRDALDWEKEAAHFHIWRNCKDGGTLHVDSWNNIHKYTEIKNAFFVFDEQRLVGSGLWAKSFIQIAKHNRWIMLTATPGDTWLDYIPVFIANGFYRTRSQFKQEHVVYTPFIKFPKVQRYTGVGKLVKQRNSLLIHMPYERHTTRISRDVPVSYDEELLRKVVKKRWHVYENRPLRDVSELFSVMRKVVNSDESRITSVRSLMQVHPRLIVFYNFDYELQILRTLVGQISKTSESSAKPCSESLSQTGNGIGFSTLEEETHLSEGITVDTTGFQLAEWNGHKHQEVPQTKRWVYLVQYAAGAEGWNCIDTNAICFYSLTYSYKLYHQAHGRIDRLNTRFVDLYYYTLKSTAAIDRAVAKALSEKRNFNESKLSY